MYTKIVKWHSSQQMTFVISLKGVSRDEVGATVETLFHTRLHKTRELKQSR
jgi:hypothetical protein